MVPADKGDPTAEAGEPGQLENVHVMGFEALEAPRAMRQRLPASPDVSRVVLEGRRALRAALAGTDPRLIAIVGPCSIHEPGQALDYAGKLVRVAEQVQDQLLVLMRVYFEKPRTTVGWKGLINDPRLDGSRDIMLGLSRARELLLEITGMGLPCATEFLDPVVPQYTADLVSWAAIGARTTESQTHREMASGLSMPVGFKNATDGGLQVALDALVSARQSHAFVGVGPAGNTAVVRTTGNPDVHLVLRGGGGEPNYSRAHIAFTKVRLEEVGASRRVLVDCSHGNSNKDHRRQPIVFRDLLHQVLAGEDAILGMMLESHLVEGRQSIRAGETPVYGQSITDACIGWETTAELLCEASTVLEKHRRK